MFMRWDVLAVTAAALIALTWLYRRDRERFRRLRGGFFSTCLDLFEHYRVVQNDVDFPVLTGRYRGHEVRLEPIVDHLTMRKLPSASALRSSPGRNPGCGGCRPPRAGGASGHRPRGSAACRAGGRAWHGTSPRPSDGPA